MELITFTISISLALGLSAACGFRVFIPPLAYGLFYKAELVDLGSSWTWIGNDWVIAVFAIAAIVEVCSALIPWVDNFLDIIATPAAIIAGTVLSTACLDGLDPGLQWILSIICGLGVTGSLQLSTVTLRGLSTVFTGGLANPIVSISEDILSILTAFIVILFPLLGIVFVILIFILIRYSISKLRSKKRMQNDTIEPSD